MRLAALLLAAVVVAGGCGRSDAPPDHDDGTVVLEERLRRTMTGTIDIAVPAVLQPLLSNAAANFSTELRVEVEVIEQPTAIAIDRLCAGEVDIAGSRRPLTAAEGRSCERNRVETVRIEAAHHAVGIVASRELGLQCLTLGTLRELWRPGSARRRYALFGPQPDTDTFELFTEVVNGAAGRIRTGWHETEDADVLEARVGRSDNAVGFGNYSLLRPIDEADVRFVAVDAGVGCVAPSPQSTVSHRYAPLAEELYLYVARQALGELRVRSFMRFFVENYDQLVAGAPAVEPASDHEIAHARGLLPDAPYPKG